MASPSKTWTSNRPPTEASQFTTNYLAVRALKKWGTESQKERIARRIEVVRNWVHKTSAKDTEDRVFRLYALQIVGVFVHAVNERPEPSAEYGKELADQLIRFLAIRQINGPIAMGAIFAREQIGITAEDAKKSKNPLPLRVPLRIIPVTR